MTADSWQRKAQAIVANRAYWVAIWLFRVANLVGVPTVLWFFGFEIGFLPAAPVWANVILFGVAALALLAGWGLLLRAGLLRPMFIDHDPRISGMVAAKVRRDIIPHRRTRS
ncbi:hypothetical protein [Plantactinospora endophytica]|uniref:DUF4282 domain-containing protein n=1 Tax=Plantactinospora endophytica TaxID=673535 RepID=A0ABQ4DS83_9ACTN|nr:hypothetical protein [Plantactinospora endophytica]GIG85318.1 hypothetical protein Pen02_02540 [Plantactinospora endophytica]